MLCLQAGSEDYVKQTTVSKDTRQPGQQQYRPVQLNNIPLPTTGGTVTCESNCFNSDCWDGILKYRITLLIGPFFPESVPQKPPFVLTLIFRAPNPNAPANGRIYFHFKCPSLHLSGTAFSLLSMKRCIYREVSSPFGRRRLNALKIMLITQGVLSLLASYESENTV